MEKPRQSGGDWVTRQLSGTWEPSALMLTEPLKQQNCESLSREAAASAGDRGAPNANRMGPGPVWQFRDHKIELVC
jgi:hypothetical protein